MNDQISIKCKHCSKIFEVDRLKLASHWGKKVKIRCKLCKIYNEVNVNAGIMSGKTHSASEAEPKTEFTIHINPNDKSLQIAKLHVIANENNRAQSFFLEEGEYLIGRQSDDDLSVVNKIRIVTEDTKMSRSHCQISVVMKADKTYRYILTDLGSLNGTHLETTSGTKKLDKNEKVIIQLGDIVGLGYRTQIKIEI